VGYFDDKAYLTQSDNSTMKQQPQRLARFTVLVRRSEPKNPRRAGTSPSFDGGTRSCLYMLTMMTLAEEFITSIVQVS
jgi:hypothetical protein